PPGHPGLTRAGRAAARPARCVRRAGPGGCAPGRTGNTDRPMQTFLPYPGFAESALVLDRRRLGTQRVEAIPVLRGLIVPGYGWRRHPAVRMWTGYEEALVRYGLEVCRIWREPG